MANRFVVLRNQHVGFIELSHNGVSTVTGDFTCALVILLVPLVPYGAERTLFVIQLSASVPRLVMDVLISAIAEVF